MHFLGICFTVSAGFGPDGLPTGEEYKAYWIDFSEYLNEKEPAETVKIVPAGFLHNLHHLAAAAGDHLARFHVQQLVADGAVDVTFLLRPDNKATQAGF